MAESLEGVTMVEAWKVEPGIELLRWCRRWRPRRSRTDTEPGRHRGSGGPRCSSRLIIKVKLEGRRSLTEPEGWRDEVKEWKPEEWNPEAADGRWLTSLSLRRHTHRTLAKHLMHKVELVGWRAMVDTRVLGAKGESMGRRAVVESRIQWLEAETGDPLELETGRPDANIGIFQGNRAGSWWKPFIFLDEAGFNLAMTWRRGCEPSSSEWPRTMLAGGPNHPPLNVILRGPHSKIMVSQIVQSQFQANPQFITLYLPPYSPFLTVTRLKNFSPHGGGRFTIYAPSQTSHSSPGHRWCVQWPHRRPIFQDV